MTDIRVMIHALNPPVYKAIVPKFGIVVSHVTGMALWEKETERKNLIKAMQKKNKRNKRNKRRIKCKI